MDSTSYETDELYVLWANADRETALTMVFMYAFNAKVKRWWENVSLIIWGPSAKLLAQDEELQGRTRQMMEAGVKVEACIACSQIYGVSEILRNLGIEVKPMGEPLTKLLKANKKILTV